MATRLPPEYVPAEDRPALIAELERQVAREWRRFAFTEAVVIWFPFAVFIAVYALTDAIPDSALKPIAFAFMVPVVLLVGYWLRYRVMPLQREIKQLKALDTAPTQKG